MSPIEKLYIYEVSGKVADSPGSTGPGFLGCWREAGYSYLFYSAPGKQEVEQLIAESDGCEFVSETELDYDQWEPADALKQFEIAPLTVIPAWLAGEDVNPMEIRIDPGVVFGAGAHYTTRRCLEFLIFLMKEEHVHRVIDLGTGTGILALAAARMGAVDVIAVDNNNLAVETAKKNVAINELTGQVQCFFSDAAEFIETGADLILANLNLMQLKKLFIPRINLKSPWFIVSGLNRTEAYAFKELIQGLNLKIVRHEMDNLWSTFLLKKM